LYFDDTGTNTGDLIHACTRLEGVEGIGYRLRVVVQGGVEGRKSMAQAVEVH
jgi:hypothetical protein